MIFASPTYIGAHLAPPENYLDELWHRGVPEQALINQQMRDRNRHHVTLIAPQELDQLVAAAPKSSQFEVVHRQTVVRSVLGMFEAGALSVPNILGLGQASRSSATCYFYVVQWPVIQTIRGLLHLPPRQLHITVAFSPEDLHDVDKGADSLLPPLGHR